MADSKYRKVGKISDAFGLRGELYALIFSGDVSWLSELEEVLLNKKNYKVLKAKPHKKGCVLKLENLADRTAAEYLIGAELSVPEEIFISEDGEALYLSEIENFNVIDQNLGAIGVITGFSSNTVQDLLVITLHDENYEIPFVEDFIQSIDHEKQTIYTDLPEGLLEINKK